jgi:prepilin-type N-terminal cleavage/methylation domain-containing protein
MKYLKKQNGFSLLELLIVILVIIGLATISAVAVNSQRAKARDAKRISDIRQIQTALEFYKSDEGEYPVVADPIILGKEQVKLCGKAEGGFVSASKECQEASTYMTAIPTDPLSGKDYFYAGTAETYDLQFTTERQSILGVAGTYFAHPNSTDLTPSL